MNLPPEPAKLRVLVVDDYEDAAAVLAALVKTFGHDVRTAHDGASAMEQAREFLPRVALLDLGLPRMDGYALAEQLRRQSPPESITLIAVTGYGRELDQRQLRESGFHHYFVKPIAFDELRRILAAIAV